LANWGVGSNDELRGWFLEDDVQDAILFFDFNRGLVFGCDQALFQVFYGHIGLATEIEFVEHGDIIGGGCCWCRWPWTHSLPRMVLSANVSCSSATWTKPAWQQCHRLLSSTKSG